jgi:hypothetical protein
MVTCQRCTFPLVDVAARFEHLETAQVFDGLVRALNLNSAFEMNHRDTEAQRNKGRGKEIAGRTIHLRGECVFALKKQNVAPSFLLRVSVPPWFNCGF